MGTELSKATGKVVGVAQIEYAGEKLILPEKMTIPVAVDLLLRRYEYDQEVITISDEFAAYPWDGALALGRVLEQMFGWAPHRGQSPTVEVGPRGKTVQVPWGTFQIPTIGAEIKTDASPTRSGAWQFIVTCRAMRGHEGVVRAIFTRVREELRERSIYRGKAVKLDFSEGEMPMPKFLDTEATRDDLLVLPNAVQNAVDTNLFTPIERIRELASNDLPVKRGILLAGLYGTGKTLTSAVAAKKAVRAGVTFIHCVQASCLAQAIAFARQYQEPGCVVFCEDIDREMGGARSEEMDSILNIIDGLDSKETRVMVVLTTNDIKSINAAMLRAGRLDAVIEFSAPDADAVQRLIRIYGGDLISVTEDLRAVGAALQGHIPATIAEVVKRAKLSMLKYTPKGQLVEEITSRGLLDAVDSMAVHLKALKDAIDATQPKVTPSLDEALGKVVEGVLSNGGGKAIAEAVARRME